MPDLDQRIADGLRALVDRAPVEADVWPATERYVAKHRRHRRTIAGAVVAVAPITPGTPRRSHARTQPAERIPLADHATPPPTPLDAQPQALRATNPRSRHQTGGSRLRG